jgi:hypothetical protein
VKKKGSEERKKGSEGRKEGEVKEGRKKGSEGRPKGWTEGRMEGRKECAWCLCLK